MNQLRKELNQISKAEKMLEYFGIPYKHKLLKNNRHLFLKHVRKHMEHCGNLDAYDEVFLYHLYKDILEVSYKETAKTHAA